MEIDMISTGNRIKKRRTELGLTQTDIFNTCGIASGVLSRIENGKNTPSVVMFYKLSLILSCDMTWLLTGITSNIQSNTLYKNEEQLINGFRELPEDDQEELLGILQMKLNKTHKTKRGSVKSPPSTGIENSNLVG